MTVTTAVVVLPRRVAVWASRRALARNSLTGIELACACAPRSGSAPAPRSPRWPAARRWAAATWPGGSAASSPWVRSTAGWPVVCALAGELAVYAGLAVGAAGRPAVAWALATAAAMLLALRKVARLCRPAQPACSRGPSSLRRTGAAADDPPGCASAVLVGQVLALPAWERAVVITVTAAFYGTRMSLLVLTCWGAVALAWSLVAGPHRRAAAVRTAGHRALRRPQPGGRDRGRRDDGPLARFAGALVRGQLVPLPPAVAGLTATVLLATLGLRDLDGPGPAHPGGGHAAGRAGLGASARRAAGLAGPGHHPGRPVRLPGRARLRQRRARPGHVRADRARRRCASWTSPTGPGTR